MSEANAATEATSSKTSGRRPPPTGEELLQKRERLLGYWKEYYAKRYKDPAFVDAAKERVRQYRERNPDRVRQIAREAYHTKKQRNQAPAGPAPPPREDESPAAAIVDDLAALRVAT